MTTAWKRAQKVMALVALLSLSCCDLSDANNQTEYQDEGSGSGNNQPEAVTNLNISYNETDNTIQITWDDLLNINDTDLGYRIDYSFSALDTVVAMDTVIQSNVLRNSTSFEYDIQAAHFSEDGVMINVTVQACNSFSLGEARSINLDFMGVFAPSPANLTLVVSSLQPPAITLFWDDPFGNLSPDQLIVTTVATKLSGTPLIDGTATLTLTAANLTTGMDGFNSSYTLSNLEFYSNYSISLAAVYSEETSTAVVRQATTIQGVPGPVRNVLLSFGSTISFDSSSNEIIVPISITWVEPLEPNGVVDLYDYTLVDANDVPVQSTLSTDDTSVVANVTVSPYQLYRVRVVAITTGGTGEEAAVSILQRSPEAAPSPTANITVTVITSRTALVTWVEPATPNGVITGYTLTLTFSTGSVINNTVGTDTMFSAVDLRPFTEYIVSVQGITGGGTGESGQGFTFTTLEDIPTPVQALDLVVNSTHLIVTWSAPMNPNGVVSYSVTLSGVNLVDSMGIVIDPSSAIVMETSYTVAHSSIPYSNYTAIVFASTSAGDSTMETVTKQTPEEAPSAVVGLALNVTGSQLIVSWDTPSTPNGVITGYSVTLSGVNLVNSMGIVIDPNSAIVMDTSYTVAHSSIPYSNYTAIVFASTSVGDSTMETFTKQTPEDAPSAVVGLALDVTTGSQLMVSWDTPSTPNGVITGYNVTLSGVNLVNSMEIVIDPNSAIVMDTSYTVAHSSIPYSDYTVVVFASTSAGPGTLTTVTEQTDEEAPSPTANITVTDITSRTALVTWVEPATPNGVITGYTLTLTFNTGSVINDTVGTDTIFSAVDLRPFTEYIVSVQGITGGGTGESGQGFTFTTLEDIPTPVRALDLVVNSTHLIVTWSAPMNPNGVVSYSVTLSGVNLVDSMGIVIDPSSAIVMETSYTVAHSSIPYSNYTVVVFASTSAGDSGVETVTEQTPEDAPSAVVGLALNVTTGSQLIVSWDTPSTPNGVITGYNVTLSGVNLVNSMEIGIDPNSAIVMDTSYTVAHSSIPYSDYTVVVFASTSAGPGPLTTVTEQTDEEVPTPVQELSLVVNGTHLTVSWNPPLLPNGVVSYNVTLSGVNLANNEAITISENSAIVDETSYTVAHSSIPYSNYTVIVFASTSAGDSTMETFTKQTPEDAPSVVQNLMSTFNITSYNAASGFYEGMLQISWSEPLFPNGVITEYSYTVLGPSPATDTIVSASTDVMVTVSLLPAITYTVRVTASTSAGAGEASMVTISVPEAIPSPVVNLMLMMTNSSSLTATWDAPLMPNGNLTYTTTLSYTDLATDIIETVLTQQTTEDDRSVTYNSMTSLEPYARYDVVVIASTSVGNSTAAMESIFTSQGVSESPSNLMVIATNTTVEVMWAAPSDPNGVIFAYSLTLQDSSTMMMVSSQNEANTTLISNFDNLVPFSDYTVTVRALTGDNGEILGVPAMDTFMTDTGVPTSPRNLRVLVSSSTSLNVTWDPPSSLNAPTVSYIIRYRNASSVTLLQDLVETELFIDGLQPFMEYFVSVQACSTQGCSDFTMEVMRLTGEEVPSPVVNLMLMMTNSSSLTATWDAPLMPNGNLTYTTTLSYTDLATDIIETVLTQQTTEDDRSVTYNSMTSLEPYARYDVVVIASTSVGDSDAATASVVTAQGVSEAPGNLMVIATNTTVEVMWAAPSDPNGVIFAYSLTLLDSSMVVVVSNQNEASTTFISNFDNLVPFSDYTVTVRALTGDNGEILGVPAMDTFMTDTGTPSAPTLPLLNAPSPTTIQVEWAEPSIPNGIITAYLVSYYQTNVNGFTIQTNTTDGTITSIELTGLTVFTNYSVFVRAVTTLVGPPSDTVTVVTQEDVPGPPLSLMALELNSTSINVSWTAPSKRNGILLSYTVYYDIDNLDGSFGEEQSTSISVLEGVEMQFVILENLIEFTSYRVVVTATTIAGEGERSGSVSVTTDPDSASPPRFVNLTVISSTAIEVRFSYPSIPRGEIYGYLIEYGISETNESHSSSNLTVLNRTLDTLDDMSNQTVTIDSLLPFTNYVFRVAAYSFSDTPFQIHIGIFSLDSDSVRTNEDLPTAPLNFAMETTSVSSQLTASWQPPVPANGVITGYTVYCARVATMDEMPSDDNFIPFVQTGGADLRVMINDLQAFTFYHCFVAANTSVGEGRGSNRDTTRTIQDAPNAPPQNLALTPLTSTSINIMWEAPPTENQRGILTNYTISYQIEGMSAISAIVGANVLFLELMGLEKFTMYSVSVGASTVVGPGPVAMDTVITLSDIPSQPLNLDYTNDTSTSVILTWATPTSPNGIIESYTLQISDVSTISTPVLVPNITNIDGNLVEYTLTGLLPFHTYELVLYALTDRGEGPGSTTLTLYTLEDLPTSPLTFALSVVVASTELTASWFPPVLARGHITAYTLYCNSSTQQAYPEISSSAVLAPITVNGDSIMRIITGLTPYTSYDCHVTASTTVGEGPPSNTETETTAQAAPGDPPQNFQAGMIASTQVSLSWSRPRTPNGVITHYTVTYSNETTNNSTMVEYVETVTGYIVDGLNEFTAYRFTVSATTSAGTGPQALLIRTTEQDVPTAPPQSLNAAFIDSTALSVNWQPPLEQDQNGILLDYQLTYQLNGSTDAMETMNVSVLNTMIDSLEIFTLYMVSVRARTVIGLGPPAVVVVRTDSTTPGPPLVVAAPSDQVTPTSIFVTWEPPVPVLGNILSYCAEYASSVHTGSVVDIITTSVNLTGLMEAVVYNITVYAHTDKGRGDGAGVVQMTDEHFPDEPNMFQTTVLSSDTIVLTWDVPIDPNGFIISYHLDVSVSTQDSYITDTGLDGFNSTLGNGELRRFVLRGLHPYVLYVLRLSAATNVGEGTATLPREAMTQQAVPAQPVSNIIAIADNATSVNLTWTPPTRIFWNGRITSYVIEYSPVNNCDEEVAINYTTSGNRSLSEFMNPADPRNAVSLVNELLLVTGLEEFISYRFTVAITTSAGSISSVESGCALTNPTAPAVAPVVAPLTVTSNTSAALVWEELPIIQRNGIISRYVIRLSNDRGNPTQVYNTTNMSLNLTGLVPYTMYSAVVSAVNQEGEGPSSDPVSATTLEGVPDAPTNLTLTVISSTSLVVDWVPPNQFFGVPDLYYITYSGNKAGSTNEMTVTVSNTSTSFTLDNLVGASTYTVSVEASTEGAGRGPPITSNAVLPAGATPVVIVTPETVAIVPVAATDASGRPVVATEDSIPISFQILPEQQVNGPVDKVWIFVQRQPSNNKTTGTYFDNTLLNSDWSRYASVEVIPSSSGGRKKRAEGDVPVSIPISQSIGGDQSCGPEDVVCNGPLDPGTNYSVGYRLFAGNQSTDYEFPMNATFSTALATPAEPSSVPVTVGVIVVVVLVIVITTVIIILVLVYIRRNRRGKFEIVTSHRNGGSQKLIPRDNGHGVSALGPSETNIVPMSETLSAGSTPTKFPPLPRANSRKIHVKEFKAYLTDMLDDSGYKFSEEYERVTEVGLDHAKEASLMADNRAKNRYTNILAYDHSRVKLSFVDDEPGSDYINGCYIPGYRMRRAYLATQGPLPATFDDFWRMVWEQNTHIIVMLTQLVERGRTKCHRYWPGTDPSVYGDIAVELVSEHEKEDWTVREFKLSSNDRKTRLVRHFQFTSWPDHGVPDTPIAAVDFVKTVRNYVAPNHGAFVVHCSAGVGRTGCFIALDTLLQQLKDHDWLDILALACEMRQHRNHMIQTEAQYVFIHKAIQEVLEAEAGMNGGGFSQNGFSQSGNYPVYVNQFVDDQNTQMTDYYAEDFLSEETHM